MRFLTAYNPKLGYWRLLLRDKTLPSPLASPYLNVFNALLRRHDHAEGLMDGVPLIANEGRWGSVKANSCGCPLADLRPTFDVQLSKLAATSDYTSDCIFVLDSNWRFRHLNKPAEREIAQGRTLLGQVIWEAFPGALEGDFGRPYARAMIDHLPQSFEANYPPLGGWYEVQANPMCGGLLVSFRNINDRKTTESQLRQAEELFRLAALATNDLVYDCNLETGRVTRSRAAESSFGYSPDRLGATIDCWQDRIHPEDCARVASELQEVLARRIERFDCYYRWRKADSSYAEVHDRAYVIVNDSGKAVRVVGAMRDLTGEHVARAEALRARSMLQTVIDSVPDHIYVKDASGLFILTNQASKENWDLVGRRTSDVFPPDIASAVERSDRQVIVSGESHTTELPTTLAGQDRIFQSVKVPWRQEGEIKGIIGISRDITEQKSTADQMEWAATHDSLTDLPNRACFLTSLSKFISHAASADLELSLLQIDLDHFKQVNDTFGHDAGDALLQEIARRLQGCILENDMVARLGGDEFAVVMKACNPDRASAAAEKIISSLREPIIYDGRVLDCRVSIGASVYPVHGADPEELLKSADMALYAAKAAGRGLAKMFEASMRDDMQKRASMLALGRRALRARQIFPYYQPKIDLLTGAVSGFEALLRWQHPRLGACLPGTIAACFDDFDLATEISDRILDCTVADMRTWLDEGLEFGTVAVNAGGAEFRTGKFAESILLRLEQANVPCHRFQLEVTETVFLGRGAECVERDLKLLSSHGVKIALDDFGTGYASLRHLKQFPVDIIKIDKSFVSGLSTLKDDTAIVKAVINLGQSLDMDVVAEGIETASQEAELRQMGCGFGQGFLYSEAIPASQMKGYLSADLDVARLPA